MPPLRHCRTHVMLAVVPLAKRKRAIGLKPANSGRPVGGRRVGPDNPQADVRTSRPPIGWGSAERDSLSALTRPGYGEPAKLNCRLGDWLGLTRGIFYGFDT